MRTVRAVHVVTALLGLRADLALDLSKETSTFVKTKRQSLNDDEDPSQITFHEYAKEFLLHRGAHYFNSDEDSRWYYPADFDEITPLVEEIMYRQWTYRRENSTRSIASRKRSRDTDRADTRDTQRSKVIKLSYHHERTNKRRPSANPQVSPDTSSEDQTTQFSQGEEMDGSQYAQFPADPPRQTTSRSGFITVNEISNQGCQVSAPASKLPPSTEELGKHSRSQSAKTTGDFASIPTFQNPEPQEHALPNTAALSVVAGQTTPSKTPPQVCSASFDRNQVVKYADGITQTVDTHSQESRATQTTAVDDDRQPVKYSDGTTQTPETYSTESKETQTMTTNEDPQSLKSTYVLADGKVVQICETEGNQIFKLIIERLKAQVTDYLDKIECGYDAPSELDCYRHTVSQLSHTLRLADLKIRKAEKPTA